MVRVKVDEVIDLSPKVNDRELDHLMPKRLFCKRLSFTLKDTNRAVANGIRRTVMSELLVKALTFDYEDFSTTNPFLINTMILKRFRLIPIDQAVPDDAVFELHAANKTNHVAYVYTRQISIKAGAGLKGLPFNENIPLFTLEAGTSVDIKNIRVISDYGYNFAGHAVAYNATSLALDQKPINLFLPADDPNRGIPSRQSNPREWRITFNTTGAMAPHDIVRAACDNIIERLRNVEKLLYSIQASKDLHVLTINGESDTIGNLIMCTGLEIYPDIDFITYVTSVGKRRCTIKVRTTEDITILFKTIIRTIVAQFTEIKKAF